MNPFLLAMTSEFVKSIYKATENIKKLKRRDTKCLNITGGDAPHQEKNYKSHRAFSLQVMHWLSYLCNCSHGHRTQRKNKTTTRKAKHKPPYPGQSLQVKWTFLYQRLHVDSLLFKGARVLWQTEHFQSLLQSRNIFIRFRLTKIITRSSNGGAQGTGIFGHLNKTAQKQNHILWQWKTNITLTTLTSLTTTPN